MPRAVTRSGTAGVQKKRLARKAAKYERAAQALFQHAYRVYDFLNDKPASDKYPRLRKTEGRMEKTPQHVMRMFDKSIDLILISMHFADLSQEQ